MSRQRRKQRRNAARRPWWRPLVGLGLLAGWLAASKRGRQAVKAAKEHHQEDTVPDDNALPQDLFHQPRPAILDRPDDEGLRTSTTSRSSLDSWEAFLRDRQQLLDHLTTPHNDGPPYLEADRASLNRWHWERHGSDSATFLHAHPVQV
jgi:hypothetical protein